MHECGGFERERQVNKGNVLSLSKLGEKKNPELLKASMNHVMCLVLYPPACTRCHYHFYHVICCVTTVTGDAAGASSFSAAPLIPFPFPLTNIASPCSSPLPNCPICRCSFFWGGGVQQCSNLVIIGHDHCSRSPQPRISDIVTFAGLLSIYIPCCHSDCLFVLQIGIYCNNIQRKLSFDSHNI